MGKRDKETLEELTDDERKAIEEADSEERSKAEEREAKIEQAAKPSPYKDPETGKFISKEEAEKRGLVAKEEGDEADAEDEAEDDGEDEEPEDDAETEEAGDEADEDDEVEGLRPAPRIAVPEDADAKLAELEKKRDDLAEKFDDGEITAKEFNRAVAEIDKQVREIERAKDRAIFFEETRKHTWLTQTVPTFLDQHPAYQDRTLHGLLDAEVRKRQVAAIEKGKDPLDPAILEQAHKAIVRSAQSLTGAEQAEPRKRPEPTRAATKAAPQPKKRPASPPTLANVPASEIADTDGEFAALDRLGETDPEAFEEAYARLSPADRARYLMQH